MMLTYMFQFGRPGQIKNRFAGRGESSGEPSAYVDPKAHIYIYIYIRGEPSSEPSKIQMRVTQI